MKIVIVPHTGHPIGKRADAELHFTDGPLDGLKLIGFSIYETITGTRTVMFPTRLRQGRSLAIVRTVEPENLGPQKKLQQAFLAAYELQTRGGGTDGS